MCKFGRCVGYCLFQIIHIYTNHFCCCRYWFIASKVCLSAPADGRMMAVHEMCFSGPAEGRMMTVYEMCFSAPAEGRLITVH